ncbi:hypothetical protein GQ53DRAFT_883740 [Thozetella sp. PMI_491]|nr:hypothetical protein GQ53DRAFT_883740 [Thozetella sp. PMI_491]
MDLSAPVSRRRETLAGIFQAYNEWSPDKILSYRTEDCVHEILPRSLGRPPMSNEDHRAQFSTILTQFRKFTVKATDVFEDEKENKIVVWAHSTAETDIGPYANEYMLVFYFNETGDKIVRFLEWVDSAYSKDFFARLRSYIEQQEAK